MLTGGVSIAELGCDDQTGSCAFGVVVCTVRERSIPADKGDADGRLDHAGIDVNSALLVSSC